MLTRDRFQAAGRWDKHRQKAVTARLTLCLAPEVNATKRVLEDKWRPVGIAGRTTVTARFQKLELKFQNFQGIAVILHDGTLSERMPASITKVCSAGHISM
jgi:hypothetical protein